MGVRFECGGHEVFSRFGHRPFWVVGPRPNPDEFRGGER